MNENDVLFQKVTQAYSEKKIRVLLSGIILLLTMTNHNKVKQRKTQSQFKDNTCSQRQAQENACE